MSLLLVRSCELLYSDNVIGFPADSFILFISTYCASSLPFSP